MKNFVRILFWALSLPLFAQTSPTQIASENSTSIKPGELLIQTDGVIPSFDQPGSPFQWVKIVAPDWHIYLVGFDEQQLNAETAIAQMRKMPGVITVQQNHRAPDRSVEPNDPNWLQQDDMTLIEAPKAWGSSTGGLTPAGDTIVVAVLEKGILFSHPDLAPNRWYNYHEIPDNGIDDDNNGYVDDFRGWDPRTKKDDTGTNANHGTAITGIIGAKGNNGVGVTGVNWNVKMMSITNVEYEDEIIAAYNYANKMRKLYNSSNGKKGAFVVATNASFGIDNAQPEAHPIWCAVYDSCGLNGILNIGATSNSNVNVEVNGDMPTRCSSEYLVTVTNITKLGVKAPSTGYGNVSIDLGAPGNETYTTANTGSSAQPIPTYTKIGGTSAATPHVTGAVGLMYSFDCKTFTSDALTDPAACARRVRDAILLNTKPEPTLSNITTTGGYLNLGNILDAVIKLCDGVVGPLQILKLNSQLGGQKITVFYQTPIFDTYSFRVFNALGQLVYEEKLYPQQFQANFVEFDASLLPSGVYVATISKGNNIVSRKFPKF
jgi:hypothetical protein